MPVEPAPDSKNQIIEALASGNKIEAIKIHRAATGSDLKASKEYVESLSKELKNQDPARFTKVPSSRGCFTMLTLLTIGGCVAGTVGWFFTHS